MAESVIYEDTPFAEYLADIGSEEELIKQPLFELERDSQASDATLVSRFSQYILNMPNYIQETLSTALPLQEENEFEERFKYLLCTSHLLNDTLSVYFYDSKKPKPIDVSDAGLYFGGISRRNFEILLSSIIGIIVVILTWLLHGTDSKDIGTKMMQLPAAFALALCGTFFLYRHMRRKATKTLYKSALYYVEKLVYNCQNFDIKLNKALIMIQEIELVSRGYRLSMPLSPISRIEQSSKNRRCGMLREIVYSILQEAFMSYRDAMIAMSSEILKENLAIMYNMYNIIPRPEGDEWDLKEEDILALEHLKHCFQKVHTKRRELLCHFLALDVMTPGRDSGRRDYEHHWATVNEYLDNLGTITGLYLDKIIAASANELSPKQDFLSQQTSQTITNKQLMTYLHRIASIEQHIRGVQAKLYICNEDARKYYETEGVVVSEDERKQLMNQYESISQDFTYMFQEWEDGKKALKDVMEPMLVDSDLSNSRQSIEEDAETLKDENDQDEDPIEKTHTIDWSRTDEPLDVLEQVFEAEAEIEVESATKKLTREERIAIQKAKRIEEAKSKETRSNSERMVHELKDVLGRRKPLISDDDHSQPTLEKPDSTQIHETRATIIAN
ncbi:Mysoin-binding motif of peroxisomes-domain-containing protein [Gigaspora margarita]|uniref:Vezatin n=1 Tax=Gigaspora margarita TaxID=4874 RepID=A0A8H3X5J3_GIGMA|nr:Mysoin-binding motif of peroxisomes-domain-containing protein [Gigaspora margarita]